MRKNLWKAKHTQWHLASWTFRSNALPRPSFHHKKCTWHCFRAWWDPWVFGRKISGKSEKLRRRRVMRRRRWATDICLTNVESSRGYFRKQLKLESSTLILKMTICNIRFAWNFSIFSSRSLKSTFQVLLFATWSSKKENLILQKLGSSLNFVCQNFWNAILLIQSRWSHILVKKILLKWFMMLYMSTCHHTNLLLWPQFSFNP